MNCLEKGETGACVEGLGLRLEKYLPSELRQKRVGGGLDFKEESTVVRLRSYPQHGCLVLGASPLYRREVKRALDDYNEGCNISQSVTSAVGGSGDIFYYSNILFMDLSKDRFSFIQKDFEDMVQ